MEDEFACKDGDEAAGLFYECHDGYFAGGVCVCDEQASVGYYKKDCEQPDPVIFKGGFKIKCRI